MEDYLPILESLRQAGVAYAAIGTWALKVYFPEKMADYTLHDCDIVLAPTEDNVRLAIQVLQQQGWQTMVWGNAVDAGTDFAELAGKYYVRATSGEWVVDMTYECAIDWSAMAGELQFLHGLPVAALAHIFALKRRKEGHAGEADALARRLLDP